MVLKVTTPPPKVPEYTLPKITGVWANTEAAFLTQEERASIARGVNDSAKGFSDQEEIRLIARDGNIGQHGVRFFVTPELNETRTVNYQEVSEMRQAGGILIYIGTQARTYQLTARMVSRTKEEADLTYRYTHILKSWTTPRKDSTGGAEGNENAPEVLKLYGYGPNPQGQLRGVPTVITSLSIDYPANVTYISTTNGRALVPIIQSFTIALKEARNVTELNNFDLASFKEGTLVNW